MRWIPLLCIGTVLVSGCAAVIPQHHRAGMDITVNKLNPIHGITQEEANGKERFVWCGACPPLTPKIANRSNGGASYRIADTDNRRDASAVIHFDFNSAIIKSGEAIKLTSLLKGIGRNVTIILRGYTDSTGSRRYNQQLATSRAGAVRRWLSTHIKQQVRYDIRAYGKCCYTRQPGLSPENRRVEIYIKEEEER